MYYNRSPHSHLSDFFDASLGKPFKQYRPKMKLILAFLISLSILTSGYSQSLPLLKVGKDQHYIVTENDHPFFWLGDTAWELIHRSSREEVDLYLSDRANKGFTVIQTVILAEFNGLKTPNAYGDTPLLNNDPSKLNEAYFTHVDYVIEKAHELGLYIALLPTWGDKFNKKWGTGPEIFSPENAHTYGQLLAQRYLKHPNLVWVLGGDRPLENETHLAIVRAMAQGIGEVDRQHLMTFHPVGEKKATDYVDDPWLDIDMFQSGHSSMAQEYRYVWESRKSSKPRPIINGEARYENIPDRFWLHKDYGWLDDADVRVSAYWSMLAGSAGYTYGCNDIWQMYDGVREPVIQARTGWQTALQLPGALQMSYMKRIFERLPWQKMIPAQEMLLNKGVEDASYTLCSMGSDRRFVLAYTPLGLPIDVDLTKMDSKRFNAYWFNPRNGQTSRIGQFDSSSSHAFKPWASGRGSDFLLILTAENHPFDPSNERN